VIELPKKLLTLSIKKSLFIGYALLSLLITAIWFNSADLLIYTDTHFPFTNIEKYLERIFSIPDTAYFPTSYDIRHIILYTYAIPFIPFSDFWSLQLASLLQRIRLFMLLFFAFISISYFLFYISKVTGKKLSYIAIFIAALLYNFNTYAAIIIWRPSMPYLFHYTLFPLFMALSMQYFSANEKKHLLALMLLSFFIYPSYTIIHSLIFDFAVITILLLSTKNLFRKNLVQVIYALMKIFVGIFILSIPLILVTLSDPSLIHAKYSAITQITKSPEDLLVLIRYNSPNIIGALFYSGYPPLYTYNFGWYQTYTSYFEPIILIFTTGLLTLGILTCIKRRSGNPLLFGLLITWFVFLFLLTGSNNPFPEIKIWILQIRFFDMLRSVYARFGEYVILSSLPFICLGLSKIISLRKTKMYKGIASIFLASIILIPYLPVLNGDFLKVYTSKIPSNQVRFPNSYLFLNSLNDQKSDTDFLYITIPLSVNVKRRFWNNGTDGYIGPDIFPFILDGVSIREEKITRNILNLVIHGKFKEIQEILPVKYVILTFDHQFSSEVGKKALDNYFLIFEKQLRLIYLDSNLAVFELPSNVQNELKSWRVFVMSRGKESIANEIFSNSHYTIIHENLPLEVTYILPKYIGKAFDFTELNKIKINSTLDLKTSSNSYYIYPIYMVLPNVTERIYLAAEFKPTEKYWNIYTGFWSAETSKWNYTLITNSSSNKLTFIADFASNIISIKDNSSSKEFPIPEEWIKIINLRLGTPAHVSQNLGEIGIYAAKNLSEIAEIHDFVVEIYGDCPLIPPSNITTCIVESKRLSSTHFKVTINATEPFTLALLEKYSTSWNAYVNGEKILSTPLYGLIIGFWINQTGMLEITIEYQKLKQKLKTKKKSRGAYPH